MDGPERRFELPPGTAALATGDETEPGRFVATAVRDFLLPPAVGRR